MHTELRLGEAVWGCALLRLGAFFFLINKDILHVAFLVLHLIRLPEEMLLGAFSVPHEQDVIKATQIRWHFSSRFGNIFGSTKDRKLAKKGGDGQKLLLVR